MDYFNEYGEDLLRVCGYSALIKAYGRSFGVWYNTIRKTYNGKMDGIQNESRVYLATDHNQDNQSVLTM